MTIQKPFTYEDVRKGPYRGEQLRRYHKWLKEQKKQDIREVARQKLAIYRFNLRNSGQG